MPALAFILKELIMKKSIRIVLIAICICSAFIFSRHGITSIYGAVDPPESVVKVMAIKDRDTLVVIPHDGRFSIKVTAGTWKLYFSAASPYQDTYVDQVQVKDDLATDVGLVKLKKNGD